MGTIEKLGKTIASCFPKVSASARERDLAGHEPFITAESKKTLNVSDTEKSGRVLGSEQLLRPRGGVPDPAY
jgi:hypothetical protein